MDSEVATTLDIDLIECAAGLALSSREVDLGAICGAEDTTFTIENDGNIDLTVDEIALTNFGSAGWSTDDLTDFPWTLAPGESRDITLSATPGQAELTIRSDAEGATRVTVPLSATQDAPPTIDGGSLPDGSIIEVGERVEFDVGILDAETAGPGLTVSWASDIDGALTSGPGSAQDTAQYDWTGIGTSGGTHTITATVTDVCGQTDSTTFVVCQDAGYSADDLDLSTWNFEGNAR